MRIDSITFYFKFNYTYNVYIKNADIQLLWFISTQLVEKLNIKTEPRKNY